MPEEKPQRLVFGEELVRLGAENERIVVLDADVSSSTQTRLFAEAFPERFFSFGIAEANMVSAAAGLATVGFVPVVSSFALFLSLRAGEQVRAQIAGPELNVKLIGGYAGLSDYADGASHQSVEDLAVMRALPNMTVIAPSDAVQTRWALRAAVDHPGPVPRGCRRESRPALGRLQDRPGASSSRRA
jgi:transketolase